MYFYNTIKIDSLVYLQAKSLSGVEVIVSTQGGAEYKILIEIKFVFLYGLPFSTCEQSELMRNKRVGKRIGEDY